MNTKNMFSASGLSHEIGVGLTKDFIANKLEIYPKLETHLGSYWDKTDLIKIKLALARYLINNILEN